MNFLTRLLAVDVPENTVLDSAELTFRGLTTPWLIALIVVILFGMAGVAFFYRLEKGTLGWFRRLLLIGLRCALLLLLLFLILRPVLLAEFGGKRPLGVALLIDNSESMRLRDRRLNDPDKARVAIALNLLPAQTALTDKMPGLPPNVPKDPARMDLVKGVLTNPDLTLIDHLQLVRPAASLLLRLRRARPLQERDKRKTSPRKSWPVSRRRMAGRRSPTAS